MNEMESQTPQLLSPDGQHRWEGGRWVPVKGLPPAPPQAGPVPPPAVANPAVFAWMVALVPLLMALTVVVLVGVVVEGLTVVACVATSVMLVWLDVRQLKRRGVPVSGAAPVFAALLYVVAAPWYLIHRTRVARSTVAIPVVWFLAIAVYLGAVVYDSVDWSASDDEVSEGVGDGSGGGSIAYDVEALEDDIERYLAEEEGIPDVVVECPDDTGAYIGGPLVHCSAEDSTGSIMLKLSVYGGHYTDWGLVETYAAR